jgi:hypothetical protein
MKASTSWGRDPDADVYRRIDAVTRLKNGDAADDFAPERVALFLPF